MELRAPRLAETWGGLALLVASCTCGSDEPSASASPKARPEPVAVLEPPAPGPDATTAVVTRCQIALEGEGPKIEAAVIMADSGFLEGTVEGGRTIGYSCPEPGDRGQVDVLAFLETKQVVHWVNVLIDRLGNGVIRSADRRRGFPEQLTPEDLEFLRKERNFPPREPLDGSTTGDAAADSTAGDETAGGTTGPDIAGDSGDPDAVTSGPGSGEPPPPPRKPRVTFKPNELNWAEIRLTAGDKTVWVELNGLKTLKLPPATYRAAFRDKVGGPLHAVAGTIKFEAGRSYVVTMHEREPQLRVTKK